MGSGNSTTSRTRGGRGTKLATTEPQYVAPKQRKPSTKPEKVGFGAHPAPEKEHVKKPLHDDETFSNYIKRGRNIIRSMSKIGHHEKQSDPAPLDVANGSNNKKENERDHFSDFIRNAKKKIRTVSRRNSSIRRD